MWWCYCIITLYNLSCVIKPLTLTVTKITTCSNIQLMRIKEVITKDNMSLY